jgi:hypothetical protein
MVRVKCEVRPGLIPSEMVALVPTAGGWKEEVTVSSREVDDGTVRAGFIGEQDGKVLIELSRETASGHWRLWVRAEDVQFVPDEPVRRERANSGEIRVMCEVRPGLIDSERIALIPTVGGWREEVMLSRDEVDDGTARAAFIGERDGQVLIELSRETSSGHWRLWVPADLVVK